MIADEKTRYLLLNTDMQTAGWDVGTFCEEDGMVTFYTDRGNDPIEFGAHWLALYLMEY